MKTMTLALLVIGCWLCAVPYAPGQEHAPPALKMQEKLSLSQEILSGLATEDFAAILKGAERLNTFAKQKASTVESWEYRTQNQLFWFTTGNLALMAREENLDGATLAYTQMTLSCVNCHKLLRHQ